MRIVRDLGDVSLLLPSGIDHIADLPLNMFNALRQALGFLTFEELPKDERPPRRIWLKPDELRAWFSEVERRREEKYGSQSDGRIDEPIRGPVERNSTRELLGLTG